MKQFRVAFIFFVSILIPILVAAQSSGNRPSAALGQGSATPDSNQASGQMTASDVLRILSPKAGQKIGSSVVSIRYQLTNSGAAAAASPTYRIQLDSRDPVETLETDYSFTGVAPGSHLITVELVDANHTPVANSRTQVQFNTFNPAAKAGSQTSALQPPSIVKAKLELPAESASDELPESGSELPLLSVVGFGVLVGGMISAMRTRR